ncbi:hypothetical protein PVAND_009484 [Polypedilum vanderplanki]|uniref:MADF domain-containing protein n=1 Tax=Polypedilum vanderplanki TaxID=319348 RepID=A0A9J6CDE6_POLVA|nr:hypothetical protein PVAND_009484 [Polypedilum vanderplanki]
MLVTQNKKIETNNFIECVKKYPEIFDTTHPGFKQQDDKMGAWDKIAQEFQTDSNLCKKKFRTLRERYTRELRRSYLEPNTPIKFEYFKQLNFLSPYIKFRSIMFETSEGKTVVTKRDDVDKNETTEIKMLDPDGYYDEDAEQSTYVQDPNNTNIIYETTATVEHHQLPEYSGSNVARSINIKEAHLSDDEEEMITVPAKKKQRRDSWTEMNEDEGGNKYFAMSVACSLKRLSTINNLKAKVEIYQILEKYASKESQ